MWQGQTFLFQAHPFLAHSTHSKVACDCSPSVFKNAKISFVMKYFFHENFNFVLK
jgi:hypothetical protein